MTPQGNFMVAASVLPVEVPGLRVLLETMNLRPGFADPDNTLVTFGAFDRLHFARFVILEDQTLGDLTAYGVAFPDAPIWLVFLGDCDGDGREMVEAFARDAAPGLRRIFAHCTDFAPTTDLRQWMHSHSVSPATQYVNWVGRTVLDVCQEAALHAALRAALPVEAGPQPAIALRNTLIAEVARHGPLPSPRPPTPLAWRLAQLGRAGLGVLAFLIAIPVGLLIAIPFLAILRRRETRDAVIAPRPTPAHVAELALREDYDVTNQFSAFGNVKPGRFRLWTLVLLLWVVNLTTQLIYTRGRLARVGTIHFARWVFFDDRRRLLFLSNYDGSLDSYMDDFINKVAYGLNLVFSNGIGYPRTRFLILGGAEDEQGFKNYLRRHQLPTEVWYKAYPGLTTSDLDRNTRIREGFERSAMSEEEARAWLALI
jgi:hypothetical protein